MLNTKGGQRKANLGAELLETDLSLGVSNGVPSAPQLIMFAEIIKFDNVTVYSPDGTLLVRELNFEVQPGNSVIIMGPNGRCILFFDPHSTAICFPFVGGVGEKEWVKGGGVFLE
eukprot:Gb_04057 [translate_table: standard]